MKSTRTLGDQSRLDHGRPNDEHEFFHDFLLLSPSYQLAHKFMTGGVVEQQQIDKVFDWDQVLETYALCGDIFSIPYLEWWDQRGKDVFYVQQTDGSYLPLGPIQLLNNKIRIITLKEYRKVIVGKPRMEKKSGKKVEHWQLAVVWGITSSWTKQLKVDDKKTHANLEARTALGILVSKKLKEALYLVENAARGKFPSTEPIKSGLTFKDAEILEITDLQYELNTKNKRDRKEKGLYVPKSYYLRKILPKWKIEMEKKLEIEKQVRLKLQKT